MNNPHSAGQQPRPLQVPTRPSIAPPPSSSHPAAGATPKIAAMPVIGHKPTDDELASVEIIDDGPATAGTDAPSKIKAFGVKASVVTKHDYTRKPALTGHGACRVRSFHARLSDEGLAFMDDKINEWLDHHPEIEVKLVTTSTAVFEGKIREPALVVNVWY
jgi:hypothetical protein